MKNKIKYIKMLIKKEIPLRDRDITGTPLSPGNPKRQGKRRAQRRGNPFFLF
jgi:hypothetical protein